MGPSFLLPAQGACARDRKASGDPWCGWGKQVLLHPGKAVLDGAGISLPVVSLCFPQVSLLLELFCGFYYLRVKNAIGLAECAAIPKQTN